MWCSTSFFAKAIHLLRFWFFPCVLYYFNKAATAVVMSSQSIAENPSALRQFLSSIATIRGDLSNITAPPFLLSTQSTTQFPRFWVQHPSLFTAPARENDPERRALAVLKWFLASLRSQQYGGDEGKGLKKPLNAILGELFVADWDEEEEGVTRLVSEQVRQEEPFHLYRPFH
jgi:oxysterol-binding protein-related protein 9/10/11